MGQITHLLVGVILLLTVYHHVHAQKVDTGKLTPKVAADVKAYMEKYGYSHGFNVGSSVASEELKKFQQYANIAITGQLDDATLKKMNDERCGMADFNLEVNKRVRRYVHQGTNWKPLFNKKGEMTLRWTLLNTDSGRTVTYAQALEAMRIAFFFWNEKTDIDFVEVSKDKVGTLGNEKENIEILCSFESKGHGDPYYFDGPGRTLAHAFYPLSNKGLSGDVHFDDDEEYTYKSAKGKNLLWVATHEIGHSLGLAHSSNRNAVMYPWYTAYNPDMKLLDDDILGIQTLYGSRSKKAPTHPLAKVDPTIPPPTKGNCPQQGKITAVYYSDLYKQEFAFTTTNHIYFLGYKTRIPVVNRFNYYPKVIVPGTIEAVFTLEGFQNFGYTKDKYQFIFNDQGRYWQYYGFSYGSGNAKKGFSIHDGQGPLRLRFPRYVKHVDAVFNAVFNGRTYFFAGTEYWRYNNKRREFDAGYPKNIKQYWGGLPRTVDAAYSSPDKSTTYFIAEGKFYLYDDVNIKVKSVHEISSFLQCRGAAQIIDNSSRSSNKLGLIGMISSEPAQLSALSSPGEKPREP